MSYFVLISDGGERNDVWHLRIWWQKLTCQKCWRSVYVIYQKSNIITWRIIKQFVSPPPIHQKLKLPVISRRPIKYIYYEFGRKLNPIVWSNQNLFGSVGKHPPSDIYNCWLLLVQPLVIQFSSILHGIKWSILQTIKYYKLEIICLRVPTTDYLVGCEFIICTTGKNFVFG